MDNTSAIEEISVNQSFVLLAYQEPNLFNT